MDGVDGRRVVVVGATGMIGGLVLRESLATSAVSSVLTVGRRATGVAHAKLTEIVHADFMDFRAIEPALAGADAAIFCMGVYTGTVPDAELKRLTVDCTLAFASALRRASPHAAFCLLSGQGADQAERSRLAYARYKGAAEKGVLACGFPRAHLFRPGYIYPMEKRDEPTLSYRAMRVLYPFARRVYPNVGVSSTDLAIAMLDAALTGTPGHEAPELENRAIRAVVQRVRRARATSAAARPNAGQAVQPRGA